MAQTLTRPEIVSVNRSTQPEATMPYYLVSISDSDGNDNSILDYIVQAPDKERAVEMTADEIERRAKERGIDLESDGGFGWYYPCECEIPEGEADSWECSHGGITIHDGDSAVDGPFATEAEARKARPFYHEAF